MAPNSEHILKSHYPSIFLSVVTRKLRNNIRLFSVFLFYLIFFILIVIKIILYVYIFLRLHKLLTLLLLTLRTLLTILTSPTILTLLRPSSDAVLHMSRIECKWAKSFVLPHLHSIRLMWSTESEPGLTIPTSLLTLLTIQSLLTLRLQTLQILQILYLHNWLYKSYSSFFFPGN